MLEEKGASSCTLDGVWWVLHNVFDFAGTPESLFVSSPNKPLLLYPDTVARSCSTS